jgi:hypothetical protein
MFNSEGSNILHIGHVGWAFQTSTGDQWTAGATEWSTLQANWIKPTISWQSVLKYFKNPPANAPRPFPKNHYTRYRCLDWPQTWMNPTAAYKAGTEGQRRNYNILIDNCLTRSVEVFNGYGLNLAPGFNTNPNDYFVTQLTRETEGNNAPTKWSKITPF